MAAKLFRRQNQINKPPTAGSATVNYAQSYTVRAYRAGAVVSATSADSTPPVYEGHAFSINDKAIIIRAGTIVTTIRTVTAVDPLTFSSSIAGLSEGDIIINLGADTGSGTTPNYDGSPISIYNRPDDSSPVITSSVVTASATGDYEYFHAGRETIWELVFTDAGTPTSLYRDAFIVSNSPKIFHVRDYGAVGDGVRDDFPSIYKCINAANAAGGGIVEFEAGKTYLGITAELPIYPGITYEGNWCTVKRSAAHQTTSRSIFNRSSGDATYPITIYSGSSDSRPFVFRNFILDNNEVARGLQDQQSYCLIVSASSSTAGKIRGIIENVVAQDSWGGGIHLSNNCDISVRNITTHNHWKGGLILSGGYSRHEVNGHVATGDSDPWGTGATGAYGLNHEMDVAGFGGSYDSYTRLSNLDYAQKFEVIANAASTSTIVEVDNLILRGQDIAVGSFGVTGTTASKNGLKFRMSNSVVVCGDDSTAANFRILRPNDSKFTNCTFILSKGAGWGTGPYYCLPVVFNLSSGVLEGQRCDFDNCTFETDSTVPAPGTDDSTALVLGASASGVVNNVLRMKGCSFGSGFRYGFYMVQGGEFEMDGCRTDSTIGLSLSSSSGSTHRVRADIRGHRSTSTTYYMQIRDSVNADAIVTHGPDCIFSESENLINLTNNVLGAWFFRGSRTIYLTTAPTTSTTIANGFVGDVALYDGAHESPVVDVTARYRCTRTQGTVAAAIWAFESAGGERTLADSATPSVAGGSNFVTGGVTTITGFSNGLPGQRVYLRSAHLIQLTDGSNLSLQGNMHMEVGDVAHFYTADGTTWREVSRSKNITYAEATLDASSTTPSVTAETSRKGPIKYFVSATSVNAITGFIAGKAQDVILIRFTGARTVSGGANFKVAGSFSAGADDTITIYTPDGTNWYELCRSVNA